MLEKTGPDMPRDETAEHAGKSQASVSETGWWGAALIAVLVGAVAVGVAGILAVETMTPS